MKISTFLELNHVSVMKPSKNEYSFGFINSEPIAYKELFKHLNVSYLRIRNRYVSDPDFLSHGFLKHELGCKEPLGGPQGRRIRSFLRAQESWGHEGPPGEL